MWWDKYTRVNMRQLTAVHPLAIPRHARLDVTVQGAEEARPHEAHVDVPGPEALAAEKG